MPEGGRGTEKLPPRLSSPKKEFYLKKMSKSKKNNDKGKEKEMEKWRKKGRRKLQTE